MKTLLKILWIVALVAVLLFLAGRFGWRVFSFAACDDPAANFVETVTAKDGVIRIVGGTGDSFSSYVGSIHELSDGQLYVGIKHNAFLGFLQRLGGFSIMIPMGAQTVDAVYLKGGGKERLIWTRENGVISNRTAPNPQEGEAAGDAPVAVG